MNKTPIEYYQKCARMMVYDEDTGVLNYKSEYINGNRSNPVGYRQYRHTGKPKRISVGVCINNKKKTLAAHRIAWFIYTNGNLPKNEVDHLNRNPFDNRWSNLSDVTSRQQKENRSDQSKYGVGVQKVCGRYRSEVTINKKKRYLGTFDTPKEAVEARRQFLSLTKGNENE